MKNAPQTDGERVSMLETVKQCLEHSRHPPYKEPATMDERGQVTSERFAEVDHFLQLLDGWGYAVVAKHIPTATAGAAKNTDHGSK